MCGPRLTKLFMIKGNNILELTERFLDATTYCGWLLQPIKCKVSECLPTLTLVGAGRPGGLIERLTAAGFRLSKTDICNPIPKG